jgi:hypothetical protein
MGWVSQTSYIYVWGNGGKTGPGGGSTPPPPPPTDPTFILDQSKLDTGKLG